MTPPTNEPMSPDSDSGEPNARRDNENLVIVAERSTDMAAAILVTVLKDAGIKAVAVGGFTAGFRAEAPGMVQVKTFASNADRAREIIADLRLASEDERDDAQQDKS